ncbi:HrgA protein [Denitratisoma sp. DHT3]|uniref:COG2958 family protein n=1 Tax=Denitratisoma sp. DHT3 TaxID=1981880 RepID=UPI0011984AE2|nr:HrgA protein [Denitratisoma sp. DHT3]QDX80688.1 HrgA protein [Denitratisoma sp. DHT3]
MKLNLRQTVIDFLKARPGQPHTARQIALWMFENLRDACEEKRRNSQQDLSDDAALIQQLVAEIGANRPEIQKKEPHIRTTEGRPRRYYYAAEDGEAPSAATRTEGKAKPARIGPSEHNLYPLLCRYLHAEFGLYPKRIDEKRASNRNGPKGNIWLFPDLVAMEDLGAEWHKDIRDCVRHYGDPRCRLWSFEVKLKLTRANVREAWFQTVSNSSWANQGYLVAAEVEGADTMKELRLLAAAHGIGLIVLDVEDPTEGSEIRIPARERTDVDWDACNRLAEENADFRDFIRSVRQFHQTDDVKRGDWDLPRDES